jgi:hypothetical protein
LGDRLRDYIYNHVVKADDDSSQFLPQQRCYAAKHDVFLNRTGIVGDPNP